MPFTTIIARRSLSRTELQTRPFAGGRHRFLARTVGTRRYGTQLRVPAAHARTPRPTRARRLGQGKQPVRVYARGTAEKRA